MTMESPSSTVAGAVKAILLVLNGMERQDKLSALVNASAMIVHSISPTMQHVERTLESMREKAVDTVANNRRLTGDL